MANYRLRVDAMETLEGLTPDLHRELMRLGATDANYWSLPDKKLPKDLTPDEAALWAFYRPHIAIFRSETKEYYFRRQRRRCSYCSIELTDHKMTYDAEHFLDKSSHPQFVFEPRNLCVACKRCNGFKRSQNVLVATTNPQALPENSADYSILHPHLDDWPTYLTFDAIGRIAPMPGAVHAKAMKTIEVCGIRHLNAARLVDAFQPSSKTKSTHEALEVLLCDKPDPLKDAKLQFLKELVTAYNLPEAIAIVDCLEAELLANQPGVGTPS